MLTRTKYFSTELQRQIPRWSLRNRYLVYFTQIWTFNVDKFVQLVFVFGNKFKFLVLIRIHKSVLVFITVKSYSYKKKVVPFLLNL